MITILYIIYGLEITSESTTDAIHGPFLLPFQPVQNFRLLERKFFQANKILDIDVESIWGQGFNSLPNDKIVDLSKLKDFTDDKLNETQNLKFALGRVDNIMGKGENAAFSPFHTLFSKG